MNDAPNGPWGTAKIATNTTTGTAYVKLPETKADIVTICCSAALEVRKVGATDGILVPANVPVEFPVNQNAAEIELRRSDVATTATSATYLWRKANY